MNELHKTSISLAALCSIFSLFLCSCSATSPLSKNDKTLERTYTLATYNVGAFHKYSASSVASIAQSVKTLDCDIISLNELDSCNQRSSYVDQLKVFADQLGGWNYSFGKAIAYKGGSYGIGIAARPDLKFINVFDVHLEKGAGSEDRDMKVVETEDFVFASTHLDYVTGESQLAQARKATEALISLYGPNFITGSDVNRSGASHCKPVFLCGDMNAYPDSDVLSYFRQNWTILSPEGITFPYAEGDKRGAGCCIDYIMLLNNGIKVEVQDAKIISSNKLSDHYPVVVKVKF